MAMVWGDGKGIFLLDYLAIRVTINIERYCETEKTAISDKTKMI